MDTSGLNASSSSASSSSMMSVALFHRMAYLGDWSITYNGMRSDDFSPVAIAKGSTDSTVDLLYSKGELSSAWPDSIATKICDLGSNVVFPTIKTTDALLQLWQANRAKATNKMSLKQGNSYLLRNARRSLLIFRVSSYDADADEMLLEASYYHALDPVQDSTQK